MKFLLSLLLMITCVNTYAQSGIATYKRLNYKYIELKSNRYCQRDTAAIDSDSAWKARLKNCGIDTTIDIDFTKYVLLHKLSHGDRYARFKHYVYFDWKKKQMTLIEYNITGGSQAGGFFEYWLLVPKQEGNYTVRFRELVIRRNRDEHKIPKLDSLADKEMSLPLSNKH